jgi:hypothetical protein
MADDTIETKQFTVELPASLHRDIKSVAAKRDMTLNAFYVLAAQNQLSAFIKLGLAEEHASRVKYSPMHPFPDNN